MKPFMASTFLCAGLLATSTRASEGSVTLDVVEATGTGAVVGTVVGTVRLVDTPYGLTL